MAHGQAVGNPIDIGTATPSGFGALEEPQHPLNLQSLDMIVSVSSKKSFRRAAYILFWQGSWIGRMDLVMKILAILPMLGVLSATIMSAQIVVPASPKKFTTRPIGDSGGTGQVEVIPKDAAVPKKRTITYMVLAEGRSWTSNEGKVLEAKLIAFEDVVIDGESTAAPAPPQHPTVVRNGKVRLLAGRKSYELEASRLSEADREFIEQIRVRFEKKTPPAP